MARLYDEAFAADPSLADNMNDRHRYHASRAASLGGSVQAQADPPLDDTDRSLLRKALGWLRADLTAWGKRLDAAPSQAIEISKTLRHWESDPDLAGIRDEAALAELPETERNAFRKLWAEVQALQRKAEAK
jgi:hypothetical protein